MSANVEKTGLDAHRNGVITAACVRNRHRECEDPRCDCIHHRDPFLRMLFAIAGPQGGLITPK